VEGTGSATVVTEGTRQLAFAAACRHRWHLHSRGRSERQSGWQEVGRFWIYSRDPVPRSRCWRPTASCRSGRVESGRWTARTAGTLSPSWLREWRRRPSVAGPSGARSSRRAVHLSLSCAGHVKRGQDDTPNDPNVGRCLSSGTDDCPRSVGRAGLTRGPKAR
jgi:hypothetical protein